MATLTPVQWLEQEFERTWIRDGYIIEVWQHGCWVRKFVVSGRKARAILWIKDQDDEQPSTTSIGVHDWQTEAASTGYRSSSRDRNLA